jgi:hypothetical protein
MRFRLSLETKLGFSPVNRPRRNLSGKMTVQFRPGPLLLTDVLLLRRDQGPVVQSKDVSLLD